MDPYGDQWGAPFPYFGQVGPFIAPQAPPADGPFSGPLVALPCINAEWLRILLGAADVLRNPSSWAPVTESSLSTVLQQVDELKGQLSTASACVNPIVGLSLDACILVATFADGSTAQVPHWAADFCGCVRDCVPPPVTNPRAITSDQAACNLAGFLAAQIIQGSITQIVNGINASLTELAIANSVANYLAQFGFVWTSGFVTAFHDLYVYISSGTLAHFTFAETDPVLKSDLTCAIFSAIRPGGQITASNFAALTGNVCGLSYTYPDVITAICSYVTNLGVDGLAALEVEGALIDEDCTACTNTWCWFIDFRAGPAGFVPTPGSAYGTWSAGVGWVMQHVSGSTGLLDISLDMPGTSHVTSVKAHLFANSAAHSLQACLNPSISVAGPCQGGVTYAGPYGDGSTDVSFSPFTSANRFLEFFLETVAWSSSASNWVLERIEISGTGANPFGADNCAGQPYPS